jgi:hypothetical protein
MARPFTAFVVAVPVGVFALGGVLGARQKARGLGCLLLCAVCAAPFVLGYLAWNTCVSPGSDGLPLGLYSRFDSVDTLGFGPEKGWDWLQTWGSWGHSPAKAWRSVYAHLEYGSRDLFGWPGRLSMALAFVPLVLGARKRYACLLVGVSVALAVGHMFYWATQHILYGGRYWFCGLPGLAVLSGAGAALLVGRNPGVPPACRSSPAVVALILGLVVWNLVTYLPHRFREGKNYGNMTADLVREVRMAQLDHALVFVETTGLEFNDGFALNDPFLRKGNIYARDLGPKNAELMQRYPDRPVYRWDKRTLQRVRGVPP